jgi:hypothetical protein
MRKGSSPRRLVAAFALLVLAVGMLAGATFHESRAEADGACLACIFAHSTVGVHVAVFTWSARPILVAIVEPRDTVATARADRLSSESRGPPLA